MVSFSLRQMEQRLRAELTGFVESVQSVVEDRNAHVPDPMRLVILRQKDFTNSKRLAFVRNGRALCRLERSAAAFFHR
jgi:hypothetical protein